MASFLRNQLVFLLLATIVPIIRTKSFPPITPKIINGSPVQSIPSENYENFEIFNNGEFPYLVTLFQNNQPICAGVIYKSDIVLTAAHCVKNLHDKASEILVRAGTNYLEKRINETNVQTRLAKKIKSHPDYNKNGRKNFDIAVIKLSESFNITKYVNRVRLPTLNQDGQFIGGILVVAGFGATRFTDRSDVLLKGNFKVHSLKSCKKIIPFLDPSMVCSFGVNYEATCHGDSGGPLVKHFPHFPHRDILVGVVSFSFNSPIMDCDPNAPSIAANVAYLRNWIDFNVESL